MKRLNTPCPTVMDGERLSRVRLIRTVGELADALRTLPPDMLLDSDTNAFLELHLQRAPYDDQHEYLVIEPSMGPPTPHSHYMDGPYLKEEFVNK